MLIGSLQVCVGEIFLSCVKEDGVKSLFLKFLFSGILAVEKRIVNIPFRKLILGA